MVIFYENKWSIACKIWSFSSLIYLIWLNVLKNLNEFLGRWVLDTITNFQDGNQVKSHLSFHSLRISRLIFVIVVNTGFLILRLSNKTLVCSSSSSSSSFSFFYWWIFPVHRVQLQWHSKWHLKVLFALLSDESKSDVGMESIHHIWTLLTK